MGYLSLIHICGFLGWFFGGFDGFLYALVVFVVCDYFTGVLAAAIKHELSSEVGFKGIAKKVCIFVLVGIANIIDTQILQNGAAIRTAVVFFYLAVSYTHLAGRSIVLPYLSGWHGCFRAGYLRR